MYLRRLTLEHFRNYRQLDLHFDAPYTLVQGQNAQGKTNLLEAIFMLATSKPIHASSEREVVDWGAQEEPIPYSRIWAEIGGEGETRRQGDKETDALDTNPRNSQFATRTTIEILLTPRGDGLNYKKQIKINGVNRRAIDLVGLMRAVLFMPEDMRLVDGSPGERRRYFDIALCQIDRSYTRALSDFQKVLEQRNSLLRALREQNLGAHAPGVEDQLRFWDEKLVQHGSVVIAQRNNFVIQLQQLAIDLHGELSGGREQLALHYLPSFNPGHLSESEFVQLEDERIVELSDPPQRQLDAAQVATAFAAKLRSRRQREIDAGSTLYGPQRDDLRFVANRHDLRLFGSRGQQRSAALSVKLAEMQAIAELTGSAPILLLDDVMSELDAPRRAALLRVLDQAPQAILTATDWEDFAPEFQQRSKRLRVCNGVIDAVESTPQ